MIEGLAVMVEIEFTRSTSESLFARLGKGPADAAPTHGKRVIAAALTSGCVRSLTGVPVVAGALVGVMVAEAEVAVSTEVMIDE